MNDLQARIEPFLARLISAAEARAPSVDRAARHSPDPAGVTPMLIAIGGLSGTGKSTLASRLAPIVGPVPGALHVRSDQIRKMLAGIGDLDRLPPESYTPEASRVVYDAVRATMLAALAGGWSTVVDTVAARPSERAAFADIAREAGARFIGLWLDAPVSALTDRVAARLGDVSDADARVVAEQQRYDLSTIDWIRIDAGGSPEETFERATAAMGI